MYMFRGNDTWVFSSPTTILQHCILDFDLSFNIIKYFVGNSNVKASFIIKVKEFNYIDFIHFCLSVTILQHTYYRNPLTKCEYKWMTTPHTVAGPYLIVGCEYL